MTKPLHALIAAAVMSAFAAGAMAQTTAAPAAPAPAAAPTEPATKPALTTEQRQANQDARIEKGTQNGELTKHETKRVNMEQKGIAKYEKHAQSDGKVTRKEQNRMNNMQAKASKDIHRQKHDKPSRDGTKATEPAK
jgi:hypothetical protein